MTDPYWRDHAACLNYDPELWHPNLDPTDVDLPMRRQLIQTATTICHRCPAQTPCLEDALTTETAAYAGRYGIRGGLTPAQRHKLHAARRRTRDRDEGAA